MLHSSYSPELATGDFLLSPKMKIDLKSHKVRREGHEGILRCSLTLYHKRNTRGTLTDRKLTGITILETIVKKIKYHSLFISVVVNRASVLVFFEHTSYEVYIVPSLAQDQLKRAPRKI